MLSSDCSHAVRAIETAAPDNAMSKIGITVSGCQAKTQCSFNSRRFIRDDDTRMRSERLAVYFRRDLGRAIRHWEDVSLNGGTLP